MDLTSALAFSGGSLAFGVVSGIVPALNTEAYLLAVAALAPGEVLGPVVVLTTLGQMIGKWLLYLVGTGAVSRNLLGRRTARLREVKERLARARTGPSAVVFASAVSGFPPFYLVSVAAGALRFSLARSLLVGGVGRLLRFAPVVAPTRCNTMNLRLVVDATEFCEALATDLRRARGRAFVQAMTFEGDTSGLSVADRIRTCPARDRRVLVDAYTRHVLSDRFRWRPQNLLSASLWREAWSTHRMLARLDRQGVAVRLP